MFRRFDPLIIQCLLDISPELGTVFSTQLLDLLLRHYSGPDFINQADYLGATPLHWAATAGNMIGVQRLLEAGAEINDLDNGCLTPIDCAGDVLFVLSEFSLSKRPQPAKLAAINGHVVDASIEYYIYLQVIGFLQSRGALPGVECLAQGMKKPARGPVWHNDTFPLKTSYCHRLLTLPRNADLQRTNTGLGVDWKTGKY